MKPHNSKMKMNSKAAYTHNCNATCNYILREGEDAGKKDATRPRILLVNKMPTYSSSAKLMAGFINHQNALRNTDRCIVLYLSHPNSDMERVKKIGERKLLEELVKRLTKKGVNLTDTCFMIVRHQDKEKNTDYHLIAATTDDFGHAIKDNRIGQKAEQICNELSIEYGLRLNNITTKAAQAAIREGRVRREQIPERCIETANRVKAEIDSGQREESRVDSRNLEIPPLMSDILAMMNSSRSADEEAELERQRRKRRGLGL